MRFHNDRAPNKISLAEFAKSYKGKNSALLHDDYFHHSLVLKEQKMVYEWAKKHHLDSLIPMHIPSGSALKQMLNFQKEKQLNIELEVGQTSRAPAISEGACFAIFFNSSIRVICSSLGVWAGLR